MDKLHQVFKFLSRNHHWNAAFQINEYRRYLSHWETPKQRINALLHMVAHTQSSPKLETLAAFWQHMEAAPWASEPPSLIQLAEYIQQRSQLVIVSAEPWDRLFRVLLNVAGWGPKTAALFVKCVVNVHRSDVTELHFLRDATIAQTLAAKDRIYLPVDAVIKRIFKEIPMAGVGNTFDSINGVLQKANYSAEDMLVWDDLWFWGFFSQNSSSVERSLGWNAARFWGQISTPKADVREIRRQCETFLRLLNQGGASVKQKLSTIRPPESGH